MARWSDVKDLGAEISCHSLWSAKAALHKETLPGADWWLQTSTATSLVWDLCCVSSHAHSGPAFSSWVYPPPCLLDVWYSSFKEEMCLLWKGRNVQLVFDLPNRSRTMVSQPTKDPKKAVTHSDRILSIAHYSFISSNHSETHGRQTEGKRY